MPRVPMYREQVAPQALPGVRFGGGGADADGGMGEAVSRAGATAVGVGMTLADRAERIQSEADLASAQTAFAGAQEKVVQWQAEGLSALRGLNAAGAPKAAEEALKTTYDAAVRDLSPNARKRFDAFWPQTRLGLLRSAWGHAEAETTRAKASAAEAVVRSGIHAAIGTGDDAAEAEALGPALAAIRDRHAAMGLAPEDLVVSERKLLGEVATGKLSAMHSALAAATLPDQVDDIEQRMAAEVDRRLETGALDAAAAEEWKARAATGAKTRRAQFAREESERQRTNVVSWEQAVWERFDRNDPALEDWLGVADTIKDANPEYAAHVRQTVRAVKRERERIAAAGRAEADAAERERMAMEKAEADSAEADMKANLAIIEAQVRGGLTTPDRAKAVLEDYLKAQGDGWTRDVAVKWHQTYADVTSFAPSDPASKEVWAAFADQAKQGAFGDLVIDRKTGRDLTDETVRRALADAEAVQEKKPEKAAAMRRDVLELQAARLQLYDIAREYTANYVRANQGKPASREDYVIGLRKRLEHPTAQIARKETAAAARRLAELGEE